MIHRLGSHLGGAYLIWDELLTKLSSRLDTLFVALLSCLMARISNTLIAMPETDVDLEADAMWTLRILDLSVNETPLMQYIMKWCCLYSGYWAERLGEQVLRRGDVEFTAEWRDLFHASRLRDVTEGALTGKVPAASGSLNDTANESRMEIEPDPSGLILEVHYTRGWVKAIVPPSTPIGIV